MVGDKPVLDISERIIPVLSVQSPPQEVFKKGNTGITLLPSPILVKIKAYKETNRGLASIWAINLPTHININKKRLKKSLIS